MVQVRHIAPVLGQMEALEVVDEFILFCKAQGLGEDSRKSHRYALQQFFGLYNGALSDTKGIQKALTRMLQDKQDAYYNKQLNAIRKFFDYCVGEGLMKSNPAIGFKYRRPTVQIVEHSEDSVKALLKVIDKETFAGLRDYAFAVLILDTGIRPNEALQLQISDIDFEGKQVRVRREYSKTRKERYLPVSGQVLQVLRKVITVRPDVWKEAVPVLCTFDGHRMPARGMQDRFRNYSRMIKANITPYHLRHIFGLWFVRNGGDAFVLQRIMGHTKMDMTRVYVNLADNDIKECHEKASPFANLLAGKRVRNIHN